jgi:hypothetical protein
MLEEGSGEGSKQGNDSELALCNSKSIFWFVVGPRIHVGVGDQIQT